MKAQVAAILAAALPATMANKVVMETILNMNKRLEAINFFQDDVKPPSVLNQPRTCTGGSVTVGGEVFECDNVDFKSFLSLADLEIDKGVGHPAGFRAADIWGWVAPSGKEVVILGLENGNVFVDVTEPENPCILAKNPSNRPDSIWADVKVYGNTAYHVKDAGSSDTTNGVEIYDLLKFDNVDCHDPNYEIPIQQPDGLFDGHGPAHNLIINPTSGHLFSVGADICDGGLVILDVRANQRDPSMIGCAFEDGYTHDAQCVTYDGPDQNYQGAEICFAFNEDTLTIWDVSEPAEPVIVSITEYPNTVYSHQGWVFADLTKVLLDDELDEVCNNNPADSGRCTTEVLQQLTGELKTTTNVFNIENLEAPFYEATYVHKDESIDHNLYVWGDVHKRGQGGNPPQEFYPDPNYAYAHNYLAGLRIIDMHSEDVSEWTEAGFFDFSPDLTEISFAGIWSGYMFPSGNYAISSIERGLFLVSAGTTFSDEFPPPPSTAPTAPPAPTPAPGTSGDDGLSSVELIALIMAIVALLLVVFAAGYLVSGAKSAATTSAEAKINAAELKAAGLYEETH